MKQVISVLKTYSLSHAMNFDARIQNSSSTAIDDIFIDGTS
jgi:hypothetical protein